MFADDLILSLIGVTLLIIDDYNIDTSCRKKRILKIAYLSLKF